MQILKANVLFEYYTQRSKTFHQLPSFTSSLNVLNVCSQFVSSMMASRRYTAHSRSVIQRTRKRKRATTTTGRRLKLVISVPALKPPPLPLPLTPSPPPDFPVKSFVLH